MSGRFVEAMTTAARYGAVVAVATAAAMLKRRSEESAISLLDVLAISIGVGTAFLLIACIALLAFRASEADLYDPYGIEKLPTGFRSKTWWFILVLVLLLAVFWYLDSEAPLPH